jgi:presenilin-like A22 family membrane protease
MKNNRIINPAVIGGLSFVIGTVLALFIASRETVFLNANPDIAAALPDVSPEFPVIYFFGTVIVIGLILFLIPPAKLKWVFRSLFALLYAWGVFVFLTFAVQAQILVIAALAVAAGLFWLWKPTVWLQNVLMLLALAGVGSVFGVLVTPWPVMWFLLVVAVYDFLAVRYGYMIWMANKLTQSDSLPAFVIPKTNANWNRDLRANGPQTIINGEAGQREFSILGGGDVGFPLILVVSVYTVYGLGDSILIACFALAGLTAAFIIQGRFLKGKPMPALPPIAFTSLIGLIIIRFILK